MGAEPTFRVAEPADVDAIVALVESAYRGESSEAGWTTEAHLIDGQRTDANEVSSLIARDGHEAAVRPHRLVCTAGFRAHRRDGTVSLRGRALRAAAAP